MMDTDLEATLKAIDDAFTAHVGALFTILVVGMAGQIEANKQGALERFDRGLDNARLARREAKRRLTGDGA